MSSPSEAPERVSLGDVVVAVPDEDKVGFANVRVSELRASTYEVFTVEVGKKFHEYERPLS
jgi:hypothetical protein